MVQESKVKIGSFTGLPAGFIAYLKERQSLVKFPLGVGFYLCRRAAVLCLPRTTSGGDIMYVAVKGGDKKAISLAHQLHKKAA